MVVMGVTGSGKTTVGSILADRLGWPFQEGDSLHPQANIEKMTAGHALSDDDRVPWLAKVAGWVGERLDAGESGVITCSALKRSYRDIINRRGSGVMFVFLRASKPEVAARLVARHGHFMAQGLIESQFSDLEEPSADEPAVSVGSSPAPDVVAGEVMEALALRG